MLLSPVLPPQGLRPDLDPGSPRQSTAGAQNPSWFPQAIRPLLHSAASTVLKHTQDLTTLQFSIFSMAFPSCVLNSTYLSGAPNPPLGFFPVCFLALATTQLGPLARDPLALAQAVSFTGSALPHLPCLGSFLKIPPPQPITPSPTPLTNPRDPEQVLAKVGPAFMHFHASSHIRLRAGSSSHSSLCPQCPTNAGYTKVSW